MLKPRRLELFRFSNSKERGLAGARAVGGFLAAMSEEDMLVEKELAVRRRLGKMYGNIHVRLWNRLRLKRLVGKNSAVGP